MKLVSRGDTNVVDAYLSPILRRYVNQVSSQISGVASREAGRILTHPMQLMFMQSNGGLQTPRCFKGKTAFYLDQLGISSADELDGWL